MTTTTLEQPPAAPAQADPYYYGWRYVRRVLPSGEETTEQVPLTLEDVLHPEVGDFIVQSKAHEEICIYLADVFTARLRDVPGAVVLHDVRVAWDVPDIRPTGPDLAVILGVREARNWSTFDVAEEGVRPSLVIEVVSPQTRAIDLVNKVDIYEQAAISHYVIVDIRRWKGADRCHLIGYHWTPEGYEMLAPDERGWLWLEPVKVWIGVQGDRVACYDEAGVLIGDYAQLDAARADAEARAQTAEARAEAEAAARIATEARIRELEAELRRLRGEG